MADRRGPSYGTPNWEMLGRWLKLDAADDGPFWALNLMRYREVADYGDGSDGAGAATDASEPAVSGKEADDAYAPLGPLAAVGAMVAFHGDVVDQPLGEPGWHRVGIVRYPSRAAFLAMQQRDDFKQQHVHKEAGMEFTIVMATHPQHHSEPSPVDGALVLLVERAAEPSPWRHHPGVQPVATFTVEGVIVGDERTFDRALFARATREAVVALTDAGPTGDTGDEVQALVLAPDIDRLVSSITEERP